MPNRRWSHGLAVRSVIGMTIHLDDPASAPPPAGPYTQLARIELGPLTLLQLSGQIAVDRDGKLVGEGDMAAQTEQVFSTIAALLQAHGATLNDVINIRTFLTDMDLVREYGRVRLAHFAGHQPTSTTVEVSRLFMEGALVEVDLMAAVR